MRCFDVYQCILLYRVDHWATRVVWRAAIDMWIATIGTRVSRVAMRNHVALCSPMRTDATWRDPSRCARRRDATERRGALSCVDWSHGASCVTDRCVAAILDVLWRVALGAKCAALCCGSLRYGVAWRGAVCCGVAWRVAMRGDATCCIGVLSCDVVRRGVCCVVSWRVVCCAVVRCGVMWVWRCDVARGCVLRCVMGCGVAL